MSLLDRLGRTWRLRVQGRLRAVYWASAASCVLIAAQIARTGTNAARLGSMALLGLAVSGLVFLIVRGKRRAFDARATIERALKPAEPELASRALRAFTLIESTERDTSTGSPELARLHFDRLLGRANFAAVESAAAQRGSHYSMLATALIIGCAVILMPGPTRVVEGLDVLLARHGAAPFEMTWLTFARASAKPPRYLGQEERPIGMQGGSELPVGSELSVHGVETYPDRKLVLTDGREEVPFVSDAAGEKLARITVKQDATWRIAARFGEALIFDPRSIQIQAIADRAPEVRLEGAPRQLRLSETERIELDWQALDDHGLREVDLVLRSGAREERRPLARFDGEMMRSGSHILFPTDAFLARAFLPVTVTIEARDTNPVDTAKWGASEALTLSPPAVGEPEALRFAALEQIRAAFVDLVAWLKENSSQLAHAEFRKQLPERVNRVRQVVYDAFGRRYGGVVTPPAVKSFALSQLEVLQRSVLGAETDVELAGRVTLAIDAATRSLGQRDAVKVSQHLADVAEEMAVSARVARETERRAQGIERLDQAVVAFDGGAEQLSRLSDLGADLGDVAEAGSRRIRRVRSNEDLLHTELAALHLAGGVRPSTPSFSAHSEQHGASSHGGKAGSGVESGGGSPMPNDHGSDADQKFDHLAEQLGQLEQEHAGAIGQMSETLKHGKEQAARNWDGEEAKARAEALRHSVETLPEPGEQMPGTPGAAAALGREHTNAMAHAIEKLDVEEAIENGKNALSAFDEAERGAQDDTALRQQIARGRAEVMRQLEWAKMKLSELEKQAEEQSRDALKKQADSEEQLAQRAQSLGEAGDSEVNLPEQAREKLRRARALMEQAARELREGNGARALELGREAQRLLEAASSDGSEQAPKQEDNNEEQHEQHQLSTTGSVPGQDPRVRAEEFRRRVLKGLGSGSGGAIGSAVKRYAEGLLE